MTTHFQILKIETLKIFSELDDMLSDQASVDVQELISTIREALARPDQQLGSWEAAELNDADHALEAGFQKLALISAAKAMAVSQLSRDEYAFGFRRARYGTQQETGLTLAEMKTAATLRKKAGDTDILLTGFHHGAR